MSNGNPLGIGGLVLSGLIRICGKYREEEEVIVNWRRTKNYADKDSCTYSNLA